MKIFSLALFICCNLNNHIESRIIRNNTGYNVTVEYSYSIPTVEYDFLPAPNTVTLEIPNGIEEDINYVGRLQSICVTCAGFTGKRITRSSFLQSDLPIEVYIGGEEDSEVMLRDGLSQNRSYAQVVASNLMRLQIGRVNNNDDNPQIDKTLDIPER